MTQEYDEWSYMAADNTRQVGGWCKKYPRLTWATVKGDLFRLFLFFKIIDLGAGHMVPTDMPIPAYEMFQAFLDGKL